MTYREATQKLHELAGDKYATCEYTTRIHSGQIKHVCRLYVEDSPHTAEGETWEIAFERLAIYRGKAIPAEQAPA